MSYPQITYWSIMYPTGKIKCIHIYCIHRSKTKYLTWFLKQEQNNWDRAQSKHNAAFVGYLLIVYNNPECEGYAILSMAMTDECGKEPNHKRSQEMSACLEPGRIVWWNVMAGEVTHQFHEIWHEYQVNRTHEAHRSCSVNPNGIMIHVDIWLY